MKGNGNRKQLGNFQKKVKWQTFGALNNGYYFPKSVSATISACVF